MGTFFLGSALALGANLRPLFEQIGVYEEFKKIGKPGIQLQVFSDDLKPQFVMDFTERESLYDNCLLYKNTPLRDLPLIFC